MPDDHPKPDPGAVTVDAAAEMPGSQATPQDPSGPADNDDDPKPDPGAVTVDAAASDVPRTRRRLSRRLMILLLLALASLVAGAWAIALFPARPPVVDPTGFNIVVGNGALNEINLTISLGPHSAKLTFDVTGETSSNKQLGVLVIYIFGKFPISCSGAYCSSKPQGPEGAETYYATLVTYGKQYTVTIGDPRLGLSSNGESAIAELPGVESDNSVGSRLLYVHYHIPNADAYDWSVPPLLGALAGSVLWTETLNSSFAPAQPTEITGTNHQAQVQDDHDTFISGILLGVAGSAVIAVVQEGLHMIFDERDDSEILKPE